MNRCLLFAVILPMLPALGSYAQNQVAPAATPAPFVMTLPGFPDGGTIPTKYTCVAKSAVVSPEIRWENTPAGTQSFVLVVHDLEPHPKKGLMDNSHWVLWNIPGTSTELPEGVPTGATLPDGTHQMMRSRKGPPATFYSYYGPCAPAGPNHHYIFQLYALDTKLDLPMDATREDILKAADGHILAESSWVGYFHQ